MACSCRVLRALLYVTNLGPASKIAPRRGKVAKRRRPLPSALPRTESSEPWTFRTHFHFRTGWPSAEVARPHAPLTEENFGGNCTYLARNNNLGEA